MDQREIEFHRKVFAAAYEIDELWKNDLYIEWKKIRNITWLFQELKLNYLEVRKSIQHYLTITKDHEQLQRVFISRNQRILTQRLSNFLFSCDKFLDCQDKKNYNSEIFCFFIHLRNYVTHIEPFPLISVLNKDLNGEKRFESFSKNKVLKYLDLKIKEDKSNKKNSLLLAKKFILELEDKPNILPLIDEYFNSIYEDFLHDYLLFFKNNKEKFIEFLKDIERVTEKNKSLNIGGLTPPLKNSEIRLIKYVINKSH
jgi:hypothetical protein